MTSFNTFIEDEEESYVRTNFQFNHNNQNIDIEIHSKVNKDGEIWSEIQEFSSIFHYFADESEEELLNIKETMVDKYYQFLNGVHDNLLKFFFEEKYINSDEVMGILSENVTKNS